TPARAAVRTGPPCTPALRRRGLLPPVGSGPGALPVLPVALPREALGAHDVGVARIERSPQSTGLLRRAAGGRRVLVPARSGPSSWLLDPRASHPIALRLVSVRRSPTDGPPTFPLTAAHNLRRAFRARRTPCGGGSAG